MTPRDRAVHATQVKTNGAVSFWYADMGGVPGYRQPLSGDISVDVCIVGAGYTGLWTAWYLKQAEPSLSVAVVEKEFAGFGASGRNGGWCSGGFEWSRAKYCQTGTRAGVQEFERQLRGTVAEIARVCAQEGIDADLKPTDLVIAACTPAQMQRLRDRHAQGKAWGVPDDRNILLGREAADYIHVHGIQGGMLCRGVMRVQPAKLVRGLAEAVERAGVGIHEHTTVTAISPGRVTTTHGIVKAHHIIRATEGFTRDIPGNRRLWLPLNSAIAVTEPLSDRQGDSVGWAGHELFADASHVYCYAQRTRGNRIAIGGRGIPYRFASRTDTNGQTQARTIGQLRAIVHRLLPQLDGVKFDHAWCGVLGVPRDWCATVGLDPRTGIGWAGGYVGLGVSTSNLAGRTLADLVLERQTERTGLPWINHASKNWEVEPLRWLAVRAMYGLYRLADHHEVMRGGRRTSRLAMLADRITHHDG